MFDIPILYIVFNRPEETRLSFESLRQLKPSKLYVSADGPRPGNEADALKTKEVREIIDTIDWECDLKTLYRAENVGCGTAVQGALDWFFNEEEMGIIIEDDIVPDQSFFDYAAILLERYKNDNWIFSINGCSLAYENRIGDYGLTRYFNMWGWATWRRSNELVKKSWPLYNKESDFKKGSSFLKTLRLPTLLPQDRWWHHWSYIFENTRNGKIDTWDYQWVYTALSNNQYCIRPNRNRIDNIGFNENSTHTSKAPHSKFNNMPVYGGRIASLNGKMKVDKEYEIRHVAAYWNNVIISYSLFFKKIVWFFRSKLKV